MLETAIEASVHNLRGVQRLAGAMMLQAIEDIRCRSGKTRADALHWVQNPSDAQFSFIHCCQVLERNPDEIRRFLDRHDLVEWLFGEQVQETTCP